MDYGYATGMMIFEKFKIRKPIALYILTRVFLNKRT